MQSCDGVQMNEYDPNHFVTPRRLPPGRPLKTEEEGISPDGWVAAIVYILAVVALFIAWYTN